MARGSSIRGVSNKCSVYNAPPPVYRSPVKLDGLLAARALAAAQKRALVARFRNWAQHPERRP